VQVLVNTIAIIAKTILSKPKLATTIVTEALAILTSVSNLLLMTVQGTHICIAAVLHASFQGIPTILNKSLQSLSDTIESITGSIHTLNVNNLPSRNIFSSNLCNVNSFLNDDFNELFGGVDDFPMTDEEITQNLSTSFSLTRYGVTELSCGGDCANDSQG